MSIEALNWSRRQRVGDALAKAVLRHVCDYADEDGRCWPSLRRISDEVEVSIDTGRRKLAALETGGYIVRLATWLDDNGIRNHERRGRQTADEIRIILSREPNVAPEEQNSPNDDPENDGPIEGTPLAGTGGVASQPGGAGTGGVASDTRAGVAVVLPPNEPSLKQDYPPTPQAGGGQGIFDQELEDDLAEARRSYPGAITNLPRLRLVMAAMPRPERVKVLTAMRGYAAFIADCARKNKPRAVKDADRWVASGMWQGYVVSGEKTEAAARRQLIAAASAAGKAWDVLHRIAAIRPYESHGQYSIPEAMDDQIMALAQAPDESEWCFIVAENTNQVGAWRRLCDRWLAGKARPEFLTDRWPFVRGAPKGVVGFFAPWPWPPRRDGTLSSTGPPETLCTDEDLRDFAQSKIG